MDAEEKLAALKKAYADIILNISKEAASRVMASEKKAARYEHELKVAKEEAVRMLTRLKQMMDSKIADAEAASLNDKKKIDELEAQLNEAEDIVRDLREELREVQDELAMVKNNSFQPEIKPDNFSTQETSIENINHLYQSHTVFPESQYEFPIASELTMPYLKKVDCLCTSCIQNRNLPSILSRGCTQRIHACERNSLDKELGISGNSNKLKASKNNAQREEDKEPSSMAKSSSEIAKKLLAGVKKSKSYIQKGKGTIRKEKCLLSRKQPKSPEKETKLAKFSSVKNADKDAETTQDLENLISVDFKMDAENGNIPLTNLERNLSDAIEELENEPVKERVFKYTYQRKRKRQSLADSDVNVSLQTEKDGGDRQLAEVARQLISLSEQKW